MPIIKIFRGTYCIGIFIVSFLIFLILTPKQLFLGLLSPIAIIFVLVASILTTCIIKNIKERSLAEIKAGKSVLLAIAGALGLISLQICTLGSPVCGISIGVTILFSLLPSVLIVFLQKYAIWLVIASIIIQLYGLHYMKCFKK